MTQATLWDWASPRAPAVNMVAGDSRQSPPVVRTHTVGARGAAFSLRPYQAEAVEKAMAAFGDYDSTLVVMATGLGKTIFFAAVAQQWPGRVLVLAHREELLHQAVSKVGAVTGERVGLEMAAAKSGTHDRIVAASVQTLMGDARLAKHQRSPFDLVIVDEAHHAPARSYRKILAAFPGAKVLGVTATPDRGDGGALGKVFDSVAFRMDIDAGVAEGWLTPVAVSSVYVEQVRLADVRVVSGDLAQGQLDEIMAEAVAPIAQATVENVGQRRTVVFTPGVKTAHALAETLNRLKPNSARAIDGEMDKLLRRRILEGHRAGEFQYLANCAILTEGYDDPGVQAVVMARPTKSRGLYVQCLGRGLRLPPGVDHLTTAAERVAAIAASGKPDCLILDIAGNAGKHALVSPVDILGGKYNDDEKKRAKKLIEKKPGMQVGDALEAARKEIEHQKRAAEIAARAQVKYRVVKGVDPFKVLGMNAPEGKVMRQPPTPEQLARLDKWGFSKDVDVRSLSRSEANALLDKEFMRIKHGFATYKQSRVLQRYGYPTKGLTRENASGLMDALANNGWKALPVSVSAAYVNPEPGAEG